VIHTWGHGTEPLSKAPGVLGGLMGAAVDLRPLTYATFNTVAAVGITFVNKAVFSVFKFNHVYVLTLIHALATVAGMHAFAAAGMFEAKALRPVQVTSFLHQFVRLWQACLLLFWFMQCCAVMLPGEPCPSIHTDCRCCRWQWRLLGMLSCGMLACSSTAWAFTG